MKGYETEAYFLDLLRELAPKSYRVEGSGRSKNATKTGREDSTILEGDLISIGLFSPEEQEDGYFEIKGRKTKKRKTGDPKKSKYFNIERFWLDQMRSESEEHGLIPILLYHMKGCRPDNVELKDYTFYKEDANADFAIIPFIYFIKIIKLMRSYQTEGIEKFSDDELITELEKRLNSDTND